MLKLIQQMPDILDRFKTHIHSTFIQELLFFIWQVAEIQEKTAPSVLEINWWDGKAWTLYYIEKLNPTQNSEEQSLASHILLSMVKLCMEGKTSQKLIQHLLL